jgi:hypothetical protein
MQNTIELIAKENPKLDPKFERYVDESIWTSSKKKDFSRSSRGNKSITFKGSKSSNVQAVRPVQTNRV